MTYSHPHEVHREIVAAFPTFLARCTRGHAALDAAAERYDLPSYLLGLMNSAYLACGQRTVTERALRDSLPYATRSRLGADHWAVLVERGLAKTDMAGWILTDDGLAAVAELYREVRREISARNASPARVTRVGHIFETIAHLTPATPRALAIRELWRHGEPATKLDRVYRAIWELWIYRDACFRAAWEHAGYTGPEVDVLTQIWEGATAIEDVVGRLEGRQIHQTVLDNLQALSERGDVHPDGDRLQLADHARAKRNEIEERTDAVYFVRWPIGEPLDSLNADFTALMDELAS